MTKAHKLLKLKNVNENWVYIQNINKSPNIINSIYIWVNYPFKWATLRAVLSWPALL